MTRTRTAIRRLLPLLFAVAMLLTMLAACKKTPAEPTTPTPNEFSAAPLAEGEWTGIFNVEMLKIDFEIVGGGFTYAYGNGRIYYPKHTDGEGSQLLEIYSVDTSGGDEKVV